jgi:hypothetical protein
MAEKRKRPTKLRFQDIRDHIKQPGQIIQRLFVHTVFAAGQLNRQDFDIARESRLPGAINQGATPRIRKTE